MTTALRDFDVPVPERIRMLPVDHRGYPVPWFVATIDGKPDFRVIRPGGVAEAIMQKKCWICGGPTGAFKAFVIGPMCAVNRTTAEPPSHRDCAVFAARACPFLARPHMKRREHNLPEGATEAAGMAIKRNPGVALVWVTKRFTLRPVPGPDGGMGVLISVGDPTETLWYAHGRDATRAECLESIESGLPLLREVAEEDGPRALAALQRMTDDAMQHLPAERVA